MAKKAYRKLVRLKNGTVGVKYADATTGKILDSLDGYELVSGGGFSGEDPFRRQEEGEAPPEIFGDYLYPEHGGYTDTTQDGVKPGKSEWIDIPQWLQTVGRFIPGGKVALGAVAVNNIMVKNEAREQMGLPPLPIKDNIKEIALGAQDKKVADVVIGGKTYSVSIDGAQTKDGRTTLTPREAATRGAMLGGLTEATTKEIKDNENSLSKAGPKDNVVRSFVDAERFGYEKGKDPVQISRTDAVSGGRMIQPGLGLANLVPRNGGDINPGNRGYGSVTHNNPGRNPGGWNEGMQVPTQEAVNRLASMYPNGISLNSATRSPEVNKAVGGTRNSEHMIGNAIDWDISKMSPQEKQQAVENARIAGFDRIGSYSGGNVLHLDRNQDYKGDPRSRAFTNDGTWPMMDMSINNMRGAQGWFQEGLRQDTVPTPTSRPVDIPNNPYQPSKTQEVNSKPQEIQTIEGAKISSPAMAAALGYVPRTAEEKQMIALTLAGELSPNQLSKAAAGDSNSFVEIANMITTMENRAGSGGRFGTNLETALTPSQYNSLMDKNLGTTIGNFNRYEQVLSTLVDSYYSPNGIKPSSYDYTHYYNPSLVNPSWGSGMGNSSNVGDHRFGVLPEVSNPYSNSGSGFTGSGAANDNGSSWGSGSANSTGPDTYGGSWGGAADNGSSLGSPGVFGNSPGGGWGDPGLAGVSYENTGYGPDAAPGSSSFGGYSAGSLGGSATGLGSGLGAAGGGVYSSFGDAGGGGSNLNISVESGTTGQDISNWGGYGPQ